MAFSPVNFFLANQTRPALISPCNVVVIICMQGPCIMHTYDDHHSFQFTPTDLSRTGFLVGIQEFICLVVETTGRLLASSSEQKRCTTFNNRRDLGWWLLHASHAARLPMYNLKRLGLRAMIPRSKKKPQLLQQRAIQLIGPRDQMICILRKLQQALVSSHPWHFP